MAFNLGISNHPISRLGGLSSIGVYLYEDIYYRQLISEIALAFYEGRQDEFVWLDLVRQFRNPEKQQIWPLNITKEVIDEISILYRETPLYKIVDETGKELLEDQKLFEEIKLHSRYDTFMDKLDRWVNLLGTILVKVSFIDPATGRMVGGTEDGQVQLDMLHGGVYDLKHGASPYYITELLIGFTNKFSGFNGNTYAQQGGGMKGGGVAGTIPQDLGQASIEHKQKVDNPGRLGALNRIYWSPTSHRIIDNEDNEYEVQNPYGIIPAVPFFNSDPAHYYFLPINEPLIYANHALNMRMTDLNHIAKFQSFGIPVVSGMERPTSLRQGRPVDDYNQLRGGNAQSKFSGVGGISGFGAGGAFRTFDAGMGIFRDGNADANALGVSLGPDTAIAVGEKGDFKFAHPNADITGLIKMIESTSDMVRVNHGLRPKYNTKLPSSGFSLMMDKLGVMEHNIRRSKLFKEREQQLFNVIKTLWNTHHSKTGSKRFSDSARLEIIYKQPEFPVDPKTKKEDLMMEYKLIEMGDRSTISKLFPHMSEADITKLIKKVRKDKIEQAKFEAEVAIAKQQLLEEAGFSKAIEVNKESQKKQQDVARPKIDNKAKHSEESSKQPKRNGDTRTKE